MRNDLESAVNEIFGRLSMLAVTAAVICGCDQTGSEMYLERVKVNGNVTLDGEALANAKVVFLPQKLMTMTNEMIPLAYGTTDEKGNFQLKLAADTDEILAGKYRVLVSRRSEQAQPRKRLSELSEKFAGLLPDEFELFREQIVRDEDVPACYNENTVLSFEVTADRNENFAQFDLIR